MTEARSEILQKAFATIPADQKVRIASLPEDQQVDAILEALQPVDRLEVIMALSGPSPVDHAQGVQDGKPRTNSAGQAEFDGEVAAILGNRVAKMKRRTTTEKQDRGVAGKAPFIIVGLVVLAFLTPPIMLVLWVPLILFVALAWLGARNGR